MSAALVSAITAPGGAVASSSSASASASAVRVALVGSGRVAAALACAIDARDGCHGPRLCLLQVANSRGCLVPSTRGWGDAVAEVHARTRVRQASTAPSLLPGVELVVDASDSDAVAACHPRWLEAGIAVVTANKRALGGGAALATAVTQAARRGRYGDSATVGAGLGAIRRLRELAACGERIERIAGVLSGTLAWLFDRYDGSRPFSTLVREAHALGLTEPDPREDIGGGDVVRKLRILARAAGWDVPDGAVEVDPRLRRATGDVSGSDGAAASNPWTTLAACNAGIAQLYAQRPPGTAVLAVTARAGPGRYAVQPEWLAADDPLAQRSGCDNAIVVHSARYRERPLVLRGPGAGPDLTAAALLDDMLATSNAGNR